MQQKAGRVEKFIDLKYVLAIKRSYATRTAQAIPSVKYLWQGRQEFQGRRMVGRRAKAGRPVISDAVLLETNAHFRKIPQSLLELAVPRWGFHFK